MLDFREVVLLSFFMQQQQMIRIVAKRYYIENGHEIKQNLLHQVVQDSFPPYVLTTITEDELIKNVKDAFNAVRPCVSWLSDQFFLGKGKVTTKS